MKQCLALLFLILSASTACTMENNSSSSFDSWSLYLSSALRSYIPVIREMSLSPMQKIQADKDEFEAQLQVNKLSMGYMVPLTTGLFNVAQIDINPVEFLKYCYNQNLHERFPFAVDVNYMDASLLEKCKKTEIDGYSALGAAIIAKDAFVTLNKCILAPMKPIFILKLMNRCFTLTEKDKILVTLELYNAISAKEKEKMMLLLHDSQDGHFSVFPHEVRRVIVSDMVRLLDIKRLLQESGKEWLNLLL